MNSVPKLIFLSIAITKRQLTESNAFSMSTVTKKPYLFKTTLISRISDISLPPSLVYIYSHMHFELKILFLVRYF